MVHPGEEKRVREVGRAGACDGDTWASGVGGEEGLRSEWQGIVDKERLPQRTEGVGQDKRLRQRSPGLGEEERLRPRSHRQGQSGANASGSAVAERRVG